MRNRSTFCNGHFLSGYLQFCTQLWHADVACHDDNKAVHNAVNITAAELVLNMLGITNYQCSPVQAMRTVLSRAVSVINKTPGPSNTVDDTAYRPIAAQLSTLTTVTDGHKFSTVV